jgi:hypothetical protein
MKNSSAATVIEFDVDAIRAKEQTVSAQTDFEILDRLRERFEVLDEMARAVKSGGVRAMIVSGPPGVGKSHGIEQVLARDDILTKLAGRKPKFEIIKGALSPIGLYAKLHEYSDQGNVLVFDDADNIFFDDTSLNLLKAALDSSKSRWINWNSDSRLLRANDIPNRFEFKGSVIFITNLNFAHIRSKKLKDHLAALESRCHVINLDMDTDREKFLRICQAIDQGMLADYEFTEQQQREIVDFVRLNLNDLKEISLRTVLKTADLYKAFPNNWISKAKSTVMKRRS